MSSRFYHNSIFKKLFVFGILLVASFFVVSPAFAQTDFGLTNEFAASTGLGTGDLRVIIAKIIRALLGMLGIIAVILVLYAGFLWMTSQGNEEKVGQAKKILINAVIGLAIILSAFTITQFILNALTGSTNVNRGGNVTAPPIVFKNFAGSGGLGHVIKEHYPMRDQMDVKRNTQIVVTFREPIATSTFIGTGGYPEGNGVCRTDDSFSWNEDCARLNTTNVKITRVDDATETPVEAALVVVPETAEDGTPIVKTVIFHPYELLGDSVDLIDYKVELTSNIKKADGTFAFTNLTDQKYWWNFQTGTESDFDPPYVVDVFPADAGLIARNHIIQITFSEAMDPSTVQGFVGRDGQTFKNIIFNREDVAGEWRITNGYKTVEFIPDTDCGVNSCGQPMYCLATEPGQSLPTIYGVLIRAALTQADSWQSMPGSGVADICGNGLDSAPLGAKTVRATSGSNFGITADERAPDNYYWGFNVNNTIDRSVPYIQAMTPDVDEEEVIGIRPLSATFSMRMLFNSFDGINVEEYGENPVEDGFGFTLRPVNIVEGGDTKTKLNINQSREFGPNGLELFYFVSVTSTVKANNQNCLYPGRGPSTGSTCTPTFDVNGVVTNNDSCTAVLDDAINDTGCAWTPATDQTEATVDACLQRLRLQSGDF